MTAGKVAALSSLQSPLVGKSPGDRTDQAHGEEEGQLIAQPTLENGGSTAQRGPGRGHIYISGQ